MKMKYFADEHDYRKYCLLRTLQKVTGWRIFFAWMISKFEDGKNAHGNHTKYLSQESRILSPSYDREIFNNLKDAFQNNKRNISSLDKSLFQGCCFFDKDIPDNTGGSGKKLIDSREKWFNALSESTNDCELVFFDPDNGIEVPSCSKGKKGSFRYVYLDEIKRILNEKKNVLIIQFRPRRCFFSLMIRAKVDILRTIYHKDPLVFQAGSDVAFFLLVQDDKDLDKIKNEFQKSDFDEQFLSVFQPE